MKYPIPFLILFLLISVISFGQDNKDIGLTEFKNDLHRKIYRITTGNYQYLELVLSKAGVPSGSLIHYVWTCNRKGEKGKLVVQKIKIPLDTAGELLKGLNENNFETIPNCADVPGCVNGLDGTTTSFNVKTDKADREYSYWEIDTDYFYREKNIPKAVLDVRAILNTVNSRIDLEKQFDKFFLRLPDGSYTFNHIIMKKRRK